METLNLRVFRSKCQPKHFYGPLEIESKWSSANKFGGQLTSRTIRAYPISHLVVLSWILIALIELASVEENMNALFFSDQCSHEILRMENRGGVKRYLNSLEIILRNPLFDF